MGEREGAKTIRRERGRENTIRREREGEGDSSSLAVTVSEAYFLYSFNCQTKTVTLSLLYLVCQGLKDRSSGLNGPACRSESANIISILTYKYY